MTGGNQQWNKCPTVWQSDLQTCQNKAENKQVTVQSEFLSSIDEAALQLTPF